jgi:ABC-2 type transport system permease protein
MLRRYLLRARRYPLIGFLIGIPVIMLLLFVYVFGGTLGAGLGGAGAGRAEYVTYLVPGILLMTVAGIGQNTAIGVTTDMNEGIIARFRTMAIFRPAVLAGHVIGNLIQTVIAVVIVLGVALLIGFRSGAGPVAWLGAAGILMLMAVWVIWLSVALGLLSRTVESSSNLPMPLILLPFLGSGFVPTDSLPAGLRQFAEWQPFTPAIETLRGLLTGGAIGADGLVTAAWSVAITVASFLWARRLYNRDRVQPAT